MPGVGPRISRCLALCVAIAAALFGPAPAAAQPGPAPGPVAGPFSGPAKNPASSASAAPSWPGFWPLAATERPLALAPGLCQATLVVETNLGKRERFEPVSLAPDVHCGLHRRLTVGVTHSARSLSRVESGGGFCLRGQAAGCPHPYDNTALDALSLLGGGSAAIAARARLVAGSYAPFKPSLRLGALIRLRRSRSAVVLDPHVVLGLANRDRGNRDQINLPVRGHLQIGPRLLITLLTGVRGELVTFGDTFAVPVGAGVEFSPSSMWDIGLETAFPKLLGPQNSFKQRDLALYVTYRVPTGPSEQVVHSSVQ